MVIFGKFQTQKHRFFWFFFLVNGRHVPDLLARIYLFFFPSKLHSCLFGFPFQISGAMIEISDAKSARGDRIAHISGTPEQKRAAENLIQAFIMAT